MSGRARRTVFPALARAALGASISVLSGLTTSCSTAPPSVEPGPAVPPRSGPVSTTPPAALEAPRLPVSGQAWTFGTKPVLSWQPVQGANRYQFQLGAQESFRALLIDDDNVRSVGASAGYEIDLENLSARPGARLYFRVRSLAADGTRESPWASGVRTIELARPRLDAARNVLQEERPTFRWSPVPGAASYEVVVADADQAKPVFEDITAESVFEAPTPLPAPGMYKVRVRGRVDEIASEWSETRTYKFDPHRPVIEAPEDGQRVVSRRPFVRWSSSDPTATTFEFEFCHVDVEGGCSTPRTIEVRGMALRPTLPRDRGTRYRVRVRALGSKFWSESVTFELGAAVSSDPFGVEAVASSKHRHELELAVSPDGRYVAVASIAAESPEWELAVLERSPEGSTFRVLPGAGLKGVSRQPLLGSGSLDLAWSPTRRSVPVLLLASLPRHTAPSLQGGVHRYEAWSDGPQSLLPEGFRRGARSPSVSIGSADPRVFFEARRGGSVPTRAGATLLSSYFEERGHGEIWSVKTDGTDPRLHILGRDPVISPDGATLAFVSGSGSEPQIRLLALSTGRERPFGLAGGDIGGLCWSPSGTHLAFARDEGTGFDIVAHEIATGNETRITRSASDDHAPVFLPSPKLDAEFEGVLFVSLRDESDQATWDVYLARFGG